MVPVPALREDAPALVDLRDEAARWQMSRGIEQWRPGEMSVGDVQAQIDAGEWFVVREQQIVAALRLLWSDPFIWGRVPSDSAYVHGLVVTRSRAGAGLGADLLGWAEGRAADAGMQYLRLDCVDSNARLCRYYEDRGYQRVGRRLFIERWSPVAMFEKSLRAAP